uniref:WD_REPEATS_REGION domain-containing protein n=1 Tax=Schistocephalus solidus TaxID=70667 RepID=A0A183T351_SCHSO
LCYTSNGSCLLSSVGNQVGTIPDHPTIFDTEMKLELLPSIVISTSSTLHYRLYYQSYLPSIASPIAALDGGGSLVSMLTGNVITTYSFRHPVSAVSFSPDGKYLAVAKNHCIMVFLAPEPSRSVNSLELYRFLYGFQDKIKNIDWSSDSKFIVAGSDDMTARVLSVRRNPKLVIYTLSGHKAPVYSAFVADGSLDCVTVSVDGEVRLWNCDSTHHDLDKTPSPEAKKALFKFQSRFTYRNALSQRINETITSVKFHRKLKILVTAFESGIIMLHQLPEFILIEKAKLMADPVSSVAINSSGDWVAVGSEEHGQLAVWEWRSKSCHLRLSSHANEMTSITFSPDGLLLATAGRDAKVKIWQVASGRALVTFSDHQAPVTQVAFPATKPKVVISSSLDGTVRAFDLTRYRNFRTMSVPNRGVQLSSLAADPLGELTAAGALDAFDAYVWSIKTGLLLTVLTGHTAPVSSLEFNPGLEFYGCLELVTASWDGTVRTWNLADSICTTYRHDGHELAVALLNATILFFDTSDGRQLGSIEGRHDLDVAQVGVDDLVTPYRAAKERKFLSITYSADGDHLLAGGDSKYICLYSVPDCLLLKRFEVTINMSLQGVQEAHDRRKFLAAYSSEAAAAKEEGREALPLPGVRSGDDHSRRWWRPDVRATSVRFSPTGTVLSHGICFHYPTHNPPLQ